ncbi:alpha/beta hydrolase [Seonamhaeicola sp.]|uniref:alpha/beta fold hydrolase n=1 Tax=Seonamhaeicola sp. TaxID=1912245 RepID=UPI00262FBC9E|nr:alpha/beta hydrolase [Seonamhaeicola sp.]
MKKFRVILIFMISMMSFQMAWPQSTSEATYVIVHGAWGGGWAFKKVDSLLTATGSMVYRPTLTGQGERVHLASLEVGLDTHITDIVNTVLYEELDNIILVGHSYGGMVITGVADSIPERISKLIYIDAFVPENNESVGSITGNRNFKAVNGHIVPPWVKEGTLPPKDVPHPLKTWTDRISLKNPKRLELATTYILTVDKGQDPEKDGFARQAKRAEKKGWTMLQLEADHNAQWSAPEAFVKMLKDIEAK